MLTSEKGTEDRAGVQPLIAKHNVAPFTSQRYQKQPIVSDSYESRQDGNYDEAEIREEDTKKETLDGTFSFDSPPKKKIKKKRAGRTPNNRNYLPPIVTD